MNEKHTYTGDRTKNHFTAYLLEFIANFAKKLH